MFDKIFEFIKTICTVMVPYYIVNEMELSCVLRLGKYSHISKPGIHWKIPFADVPFTYHVRTSTSHIPSQTLTTLDGKTIVLKAIVRFHIFDIKCFTLNVWDAPDVIIDTTQGIISNIVRTKNWGNISVGLEDEITKLTEDVLKLWGIKVEKITLSDLAIIRTIRLIQA